MERKLLLGLALVALTGCPTTTPGPGTDSGTGGRDTGTGAVDTGVVPVDTGVMPVDTGVMPVDTGVRADTGGPALTCEAYCTLQLITCGAMEAQYTDMASCLGTCAAFTPGMLGQTDTNTLGCRIYHTQAASTMAGAEHCLHAGPAGYGICGTSQCEAFCQIAAHVCTGANMQWPSTAACMTDCAMYPGSTPDVPAGAPDYSTAETSGDSFACRMYHLQVAATNATAAGMHCGHIDLVSPPCGG